jgi:hypothetical protein
LIDAIRRSIQLVKGLIRNKLGISFKIHVSCFPVLLYGTKNLTTVIVKAIAYMHPVWLLVVTKLPDKLIEFDVVLNVVEGLLVVGDVNVCRRTIDSAVLGCCAPSDGLI